MTPLVLICAAHAALCDLHHNRAAWPLPKVTSFMECAMVQVDLPKLAIAPRHNLRKGNDRVVIVCKMEKK